VVFPDAVRATVEAPGGWRWESAWQLIYVTRLSSAEKNVSVGFTMPLVIYDRLKSLPLTVHLTLALTQAQVSKVTSVSLPEGAFSVPDFGVCLPLRGQDDPNEIIGISCLAALREPPLTRIQLVAQNVNSNCAAAQTNAGVSNSSWQGSLDTWPGQIGISPVRFFYGSAPDRGDLHLCSGTAITFSRYDLARRAQVAIAIPGFRLPTLTPGQRSVIMNP
jgi:hypothetical protein